MIDPSGWQDDSGLDQELRQMLSTGSLPEVIPEPVMLRSSRRVARLAWIPAVLLAFSWKKWALAASGVTGAIALAVVLHSAGSPHEPAQVPIHTAQIEQPHAPTPDPEPVPVRQVDEPTRPAPPTRQIREQVRARESKPPHVEASAPSMDVAVPPPKPSATANTPDEDDLARIARAKSKARSAPNEALELIAEHARRFPSSKLGLERDLVRVEALTNAGRTAEARSFARALESRVKGTFYERRVAQMLERLR